MTISKFGVDYFMTMYGHNYERRNPRHKWRSFLRELLKHKAGGNLLEIGCGFGLFLREAALHFNCTGCDISEYAVTQAYHKLPPDVHLFCGELGHLPMKHTFDVVAAFDVIEHIADLKQVFNDFARVLRPDGVLIFTVPVYDGPLGWLANRLDRDTTHIHRCELSFWLQHIMPQFNVKHYTGIWRYFLFGRFYFNRVSYFSRRWTTAVLIIANKMNIP